MSHDANHEHAEEPTQAKFIGWFAVAMLALMAVFAIVLIISGFGGAA